MSVNIAVSYGEVLDKITILEIKSERIADADKRRHIATELAALEEAWRQAGIEAEAVAEEKVALRRVNEELWAIEDEVRKKEAAKSFDTEFIELARKVYITNDERARIKRRINERLGSALVEEKSYQPY
jgi:hypothetical protein